eukprot:scaffold7095_cov260-Pinguiococcus_pyrenoidosus.AAC.16
MLRIKSVQQTGANGATLKDGEVKPPSNYHRNLAVGIQLQQPRWLVISEAGHVRKLQHAAFRQAGRIQPRQLRPQPQNSRAAELAHVVDMEHSFQTRRSREVVLKGRDARGAFKAPERSDLRRSLRAA